MDDYDCLIVGGGPAGLTAAIYLARFLLKVVVVDDGQSRALSIPKTHNHAGFPDGIAGEDLVERMRRQAIEYGAEYRRDKVASIALGDGCFSASTPGGPIEADTVLIASGVVNNRPAMDDDLHDEALRRGLLRYCPVCDGFEVTDKNVGVIGTGDREMKEAHFLRSYTASVTLIAPEAKHDLTADQRDDLKRSEIRLLDGPCSDFLLDRDEISLTTPSGRHGYASIYPALGSHIRSELAVALGARSSDEGCMVVDGHQRTCIDGLYAAGDVVLGLDQISHAMGGGGVAAVTIRNDLAKRRSLDRTPR